MEPDPGNAGVGNRAKLFAAGSYSEPAVFAWLSSEKLFLEVKQMKANSHLKLRALCEGAVFVAMAQILGYIKLFSMPTGGSITLGMLPIFLYCARWGFGAGMLSAFSLGLLQLLLDGAFAWGWQSIIGDYILAYSVLGLAGLFSRRKNNLLWGILFGGFARFIVAWITGAVVWGECMPESFFGMTMTSPWIYSALYNGSYLFPCIILCILVAALLKKSLADYISGKDLK